MSSSAATSTLGAVCLELVQIAAQMRADGATEATIARYLETGIRGAWPVGRVWHYYCDGCSDSGWRLEHCTAARPCGRPFSLPGQRSDDYTGKGQCQPGHAYMRPCDCQKGRERADGLHRRPANPEQDFAAAGQTKKGLTRFGR